MAATPGAENRHNPRSDRLTDDPLARLRELNERRLDQERGTTKARYRRRIVVAAGIDSEVLSEQGSRILRWLAEWDDWTIGGLEEILAATRTAAQVAVHRDAVEDKAHSLRESGRRFEAALERYDQRGLGL